MNATVLQALILNVPLDHFFVGVLSHCVHVEPTRPEMPAPENICDFWVEIEDIFCGETLGCLHNVGWRKSGYALDEEMHVILV